MEEFTSNTFTKKMKKEDIFISNVCITFLIELLDDVEHTEDGVLLLEDISSISSVQCNSSHLTLLLSSKFPIEEFRIGKYVTGGRKW